MVLRSLSPAYGGYSIAREDGKVVLIKGAIPGELVEVAVEDKRRDYSVASVVTVLEPSEQRVDPACPVFGRCGGCHLQFIAYERQLALKDEVLADSLTRIAGLDAAPGTPLAGSQWNYRNRAQFKVGKTGEIGFFRASSRDIITFDSCPLMNERINQIFRKVREGELVPGPGEIHISAGDTPVALIKGSEPDSSLFEAFVEAGLSGVAFNDAVVYGGAYTGFDLGGLRYTVSPWTFFQAHWDLNVRVIEYIAGELMPLQDKRVLDLYAGAGNFSIPLSVRAGQVVAVEENPYAVEDARRNLELNGIKNCKIIRSTAEKYRMTGKFDVLLLDPPRPGLTQEVAKKILEASPDRIVYISCNPATLARDLKKMKERYDLLSVRQIDFFPNTFHLEAVAILRLR